MPRRHWMGRRRSEQNAAVPLHRGPGKDKDDFTVKPRVYLNDVDGDSAAVGHVLLLILRLCRFRLAITGIGV
jgi:hypothetical protein